MARVIRIIEYEGTTLDLEKQIATSMSEGVHFKGNMKLTIATYYSDINMMEKFNGIDEDKIRADLNKQVEAIIPIHTKR